MEEKHYGLISSTFSLHPKCILQRIDQMKCLLILLLVSLVFVGCSSSIVGEAKVIRVIDGDTIEIEGGIRVRYIGIDTPEVYPQTEYYGSEASAKNRELVEGQMIILEKDTTDKDRYGRLLRYVWVDDVFVNAELVRLGYAEARAYPPDTKYQDIFSRLEGEAREAGLGLWHY